MFFSSGRSPEQFVRAVFHHIALLERQAGLKYSSVSDVTFSGLARTSL